MKCLFSSLHVVILILYILLATTVPNDVLMYTDNGVNYVPETRFGVSPFSHTKPWEKVPSTHGVLTVKNTLPENWRVNIVYTIFPKTTLQAEDWLLLKVLLSKGVEIPHNLLDEYGNPVEKIEEYLAKEYPFLDCTVGVELRIVHSTIWQ